MNKSSKPVIILAVLAVFGVVNTQAAPGISVTAPKVEVTAPKAEVPAAPKAEVPATPAVAAPAAPVAPAAPAMAVPAAPAAPTAPATPAVHVPTAPAAPTAPAVHAPTAPAALSAPAVAAPALETPSIPTEATTVAEAITTPKVDSTIVLIMEEPKKKKRVNRAPKNDFAVVDVPANFEIQARKIFPLTDINDGWGDDNLDTWWGRANLMVLTESENFVGKVHLRMYPGQLYGKAEEIGDGKKDRYGRPEARDIFQLYEAWAWHRGDYVNIKIGRWDNTTRFGSKNFGGYIDAKRDVNDATLYGNNARGEDLPRKSVTLRSTGFMNTYTPENAVQFGLNNFSENISLDVALISGDNHLNRGDLRIYFSFKDLAGLENVDIGLGYRSNVFDEIYNKRGDVTHTIDFGFRMPLVKEADIVKSVNLFAEAALIGLDDQIGTKDRADGGGCSRDKGCENVFPLLGGLDISLHRGLDKVVIEAEYDSNRDAKKNHNKDKFVLGSIYVQKILNDRFTLNMGIQSENNTKDFSYAARLQGRIN